MKIQGFDRLLASFPRPSDPLGYEGTWREDAVANRFVPIYSDWVMGFALNEDGEPVCSDANWGHPTRLTNARYCHIVLAEAARRYPELASLKPLRTPNDPVCPSCKGAGGVAQYPNLICECGNLGWIPVGSVLEPF